MLQLLGCGKTDLAFAKQGFYRRKFLSAVVLTLALTASVSIHTAKAETVDFNLYDYVNQNGYKFDAPIGLTPTYTGTTVTGYTQTYVSEPTAVGDVNGDGIDDVLVTHAFYQVEYGVSSSNQTESVFLVYGKSGKSTDDIDVTTLSSNEGFKIDVSSIDDEMDANKPYDIANINGDSYEDIIIGMPAATPSSRPNSGAAYVIYGSVNGPADGVVDLSDIGHFTESGEDGFMMMGAYDDTSGYPAGAGYSVSSGDINGDGLDDVVVGDPHANSSGSRDQGSVYVIYGSETRTSDPSARFIDLAALTVTDGFEIQGASRNDKAGSSVASGDINGDGFHDVVVGAYGDDYLSYGVQTGAVYVLYGTSSTPTSVVSLGVMRPTEGISIGGAALNDVTGRYVATGDIDNDGIDDVLVSAIGADGGGFTAAGALSVIYGSTSRSSGDLSLASLSSTDGFVLSSEAEYGYVSQYVTSGDINGDSIDDIIMHGDISAALDPIVVFYGVSGRTGLRNMDVADLTSTQGFVPDPSGTSGSNLGTANAVGDVNGDGFDDLISSHHVLYGGTEFGSPIEIAGAGGEEETTTGADTTTTSTTTSTTTTSTDITQVSTSTSTAEVTTTPTTSKRKSSKAKTKKQMSFQLKTLKRLYSKKKRRVQLTAKTSVNSQVVVSATVLIYSKNKKIKRVKLKQSKTTYLPAGKTKRISMKVSKKALKKIRRALKRHKKVKITVKGFATSLENDTYNGSIRKTLRVKRF